jgi:hypothetical protein
VSRQTQRCRGTEAAPTLMQAAAGDRGYRRTSTSIGRQWLIM